MPTAVLHTLFALALLATRPTAPGVPTASTLLAEKDALSWVGAPLGGTFASDEPASVENGHDHRTTRAWLPRGYDLANADAPPARGALLTLHDFRDAQTAEGLFEHLHESAAEFVAPGGPFEGHALADVEGVGDAAFLRRGPLPREGGAVTLAVFTFRHGGVLGQLTLWSAAATADTLGVSAGRTLVARLNR